MYKKSIIFVIAIVLFTVSGCALRRETPPYEQRPQPQDFQREDRLSKSDEDYIEENINGFEIDEDIDMTRRDEEDKVLSLSQQELIELLNRLEGNRENTVLEVFNRTLPDRINDRKQYFEHSISYDYLLISSDENEVIVRESPIINSPTVMTIENLDKVSLMQRVEGDNIEGSSIWYRVALRNGGEIKEGYVHSNDAILRAFLFERMLEAVDDLRALLAEGDLHFVSNYKNQNGTPPQVGTAAIDQFGYRVYHSAPAYEEVSTESNYRYVPDGMLVRILDEINDFYAVNIPTFGRDFYIPKQFIDPDVRLSQLNHVIVIDRTQQNQAAFELTENGLNLISYTLSTTGIPGEFSFETTLGIYKALEKRDRFQYLQSGTQDIAGYAPFAIRFTGGAYIHGVPVAYEEVDGEQVDPGFIEYLHTIGTFPRSNMCVRNFTSHAEFLYNWMDNRNGAVIVIE